MGKFNKTELQLLEDLAVAMLNIEKSQDERPNLVYLLPGLSTMLPKVQALNGRRMRGAEKLVQRGLIVEVYEWTFVPTREGTKVIRALMDGGEIRNWIGEYRLKKNA